MSRLLNQPELSRLAVVGIGQELNGDDGAGPAVIRLLNAALPCRNNLLLVNSGHAPENYLGILIRFQPDIILFVDAIRGVSAPGSIICVAGAAVEDIGGGTHTLSLGSLAGYLGREIAAAIYILGIYPADLSFDKRLSPQVEQAACQVANAIAVHWRNVAAASSAICEGGVSVVNT